MRLPLPLHLLTTSPTALLAMPVLALGLLAGCSKPADTAAAGGASAAAPGAASAPVAAASAASAPPVNVTTVRAQQRDLPVLITATGTVAPLSSVDIRPQTTSLITRVHVREGQFVRAGEVLFTLDTRADEANVAKARAQLARDEAALADSQRQLRRSQELLAQNFISQGALDTNQTAVQSNAAAVAADKAALDAVRLALSYNRITAPSAGRLGAINVFVGSSVQANVTPLVSLTQLDPIAVSFSLPQRHLADALAALKDGGAPVSALAPDDSKQVPALGALGNTSSVGAPPAGSASSASAAGAAQGRAAIVPPVPPLQGRLKFVDNAVDPASGTVKVKAVFNNAANQLWPGAFVNVSMTASVIKGAVLVPQASIVQGQRGTLVFVVKDDKVAPRQIQVLYAQGEEAAVSGVRPGERVVLDGRQNVRPGSTVVERAREGAASAARNGNKDGGKDGGNGAAASAAASAPAAEGAGGARTLEASAGVTRGGNAP